MNWLRRLIGIRMDRRNGKEIERLTWYENGQKKEEVAEYYESGEYISKKCWDEDGNEIECW